jgi:hypothetical protein
VTPAQAFAICTPITTTMGVGRLFYFQITSSFGCVKKRKRNRRLSNVGFLKEIKKKRTPMG